MVIANYIALFGNRAGLTTTTPTRLVLDGVVQPTVDLVGGWSVDARSGLAGAVALDLDLYRAFALVLTGDVTLSLASAVAGDPILISAVLQIEQGAVAPHEVTWPGTVTWGGGYAPSLLTTEGGKDTFQLLSFDGGESWSGVRMMQTEA